MEGEKYETAGLGPGSSAGFEFFDQLNPEQIGLEVAQVAIKMLQAKECPSGKMPVVIGNGFGGVIFHEACGHPLEASAVSKNLSVFAGKLGQQIANSVVSAYDDDLRQYKQINNSCLVHYTGKTQQMTSHEALHMAWEIAYRKVLGI
jgi:predicted Zn-dependent protease